jgi:hypothetical protein
VLEVNALESVPPWARARAQERAEELARQLEERRRVEQVLRDELECLRREAQKQPVAAALTQAETRIQQLVAMAGQQSATLAEADAEIARLRSAASKDAAALEATRRRCAALEAGVHGSEAVPATGTDAVQELKAQLAAQEEELQGHRDSAAASSLWQRELLCQMRMVEESLRQKQVELAGRASELGIARASEDQLFAAAQQAQLAERAAREQLAQQEALIHEIRQELQLLWEEVLMKLPSFEAGPSPRDRSEQLSRRLPVGVTQLLLRTDSDTEEAHVLGERTRIGRSSDNDLQVDVTSISRHHALILAGPVQTIIEDLHSTNGVRVNGRRVKRQPLRDGDTVVIGKAQFRFVLRAVVEAE